MTDDKKTDDKHFEAKSHIFKVFLKTIFLHY